MADPLADFLNREKEELAQAGLEEDENQLPQQVEPAPDMSDFSIVNGGDLPIQNGFEVPSVTDEFAPPMETDDLANQLQATDLNVPTGQLEEAIPAPAESKPDAKSPLPTNLPKVEPEKIRVWREQFKERIARKDAEEEKKMTEMRDQAKREIADWYKKYEENLQKTIKNNKIAEEELIKQRDAAQPGKEWEKIANMCAFSEKSKVKSAKDVSRLRTLLLHLKAHGGPQNGEK